MEYLRFFTTCRPGKLAQGQRLSSRIRPCAEIKFYVSQNSLEFTVNFSKTPIGQWVIFFPPTRTQIHHTSKLGNTPILRLYTNCRPPRMYSPDPYSRTNLRSLRFQRIFVGVQGIFIWSPGEALQTLICKIKGNFYKSENAMAYSGDS